MLARNGYFTYATMRDIQKSKETKKNRTTRKSSYKNS